jgi:sarcosine oxidase / L-pipecolate oxidase
MVFLPNWDAAVAKCPVLGSDPRHHMNKEHFQGIYNENAGWVKSTDAMIVIKCECERLGVKFVAGPSGTAVDLLRAVDGKVLGAVTEDGTEWCADKVILAAGAYCDTLLDFKSQLQAVRKPQERKLT